ncbi:DUF3618 domain-containing protein [Streptomyces sp. N2-109]|uniref:DUF3618 domain-containing protein n=1 Tax=Streptomyces gossypii TaxID=2883101 RepID=A0ABT2JTM5_9ACTN|nr:DUF3618 domain-containing protein [Streptomyces gossypii]MCT2591230.1 DUF3618 domain-containing protein [Streptomyces gossypii]
MSDARTPVDIEADIVRRRRDLAVALDEIAVRVHPQTLMGDVKAKAAASVDRTVGRAYVAVNQGVSGVRAQFVGEDGSPRMERIVPVAVVAAVVTGGLCFRSARRRRR